MIVKKLAVGQGLQAFRLIAQPAAVKDTKTEPGELTSDKIHDIFYKRLMDESEKVAEQVASTASSNH
jgi:hypothetical protein